MITEEVVEVMLGSERLSQLVKFSLCVERKGSPEILLGRNFGKILRELSLEFVSKIPKDQRIKHIDEEFIYLTDSVMRRNFYDSEEREITHNYSVSRKENTKQRKPIMIKDPRKFIDTIQGTEGIRQNVALRIEQVIKDDELVPQLERFNFDSLVFAGVNTDVPIESMGDGFKALVGLLGSLFAEPNGGILLLEEPEVHMHPGYLRELVKYITTISKTLDIQFFISTHSLDLIEYFLNSENFSLGK
jgi:Predicted ATP-dependent endonuclease of the OLD family